MLYSSFMFEILQTAEFRDWLDCLRDRNARARILVRIRRIELTGNIGDAKSVGEGVYELRLAFGPGYRVYYALRGRLVLLLLIGGDKSSQQRDIRQAKQLNDEYRDAS